MARPVIATVASLIAMSVVVLAHAAEGYPDRPIRLIIPQAPGSSNDIISRIAAAKISELLGRQIVIDNRTGASGMIGDLDRVDGSGGNTAHHCREAARSHGEGTCSTRNQGAVRGSGR